jgi:hypothetical protein
MAKMVEHLHGKHEVLTSNPSTAKKKKRISFWSMFGQNLTSYTIEDSSVIIFPMLFPFGEKFSSSQMYLNI